MQIGCVSISRRGVPFSWIPLTLIDLPQNGQRALIVQEPLSGILLDWITVSGAFSAPQSSAPCLAAVAGVLIWSHHRRVEVLSKVKRVSMWATLPTKASCGVRPACLPSSKQSPAASHVRAVGSRGL